MSQAKWNLDEVQQELLDNADFVETQSVAKAKKFSSAAARWLIMRPVNVTGESRTVIMNVAQVMQMKEQAELFVENYGAGGARFLGFKNYRG